MESGIVRVVGLRPCDLMLDDCSHTLLVLRTTLGMQKQRFIYTTMFICSSALYMNVQKLFLRLIRLS